MSRFGFIKRVCSLQKYTFTALQVKIKGEKSEMQSIILTMLLLLPLANGLMPIPVIARLPCQRPSIINFAIRCVVGEIFF